MVPELLSGRSTDAPGGLDGHAEVSLRWLVRVRWAAVAAEMLLALAALVDHALPLARLVACLLVTGGTNALLHRRLATGVPAGRWLGGVVLVLDTSVLTILLHATGGPANPFSVLYLVVIDLAAVMLGARWTWLLTALSIAGYGSLFVPGVGTEMLGHHGEFAGHLRAMWVAFTMAAVVTAFFVVRLSAAIARRDAELAAVREQATRNERLAALTTLAAGAAHELGTPLATIAVVAKELERELARLDVPAACALTDDARLIRSELERCRRILDSMASDAGETAGETPSAVTLAQLASDTLRELPDEAAGRVRVASPSADVAAVLPRRAVVRAITSLVRNALDATAPRDTVTLALAATAAVLRIEVRDTGPGMAPEVLRRAVEPFFTTKPTGRGLGLGLFLTKTIAERMGGTLDLESRVGAGVRAVLSLPLAAPGEPA